MAPSDIFINYTRGTELLSSYGLYDMWFRCDLGHIVMAIGYLLMKGAHFTVQRVFLPSFKRNFT